MGIDDGSFLFFTAASWYVASGTAVRGKEVFEHGFAEIIEEFDEMDNDNRKYRLLRPTIQREL